MYVPRLVAVCRVEEEPVWPNPENRRHRGDCMPSPLVWRLRCLANDQHQPRAPARRLGKPFRMREAHGLRPDEGNCSKPLASPLLSSIYHEAVHTVGVIFALRRKKLVGSYLFLRATSRS
jgi:hypothetical protein